MAAPPGGADPDSVVWHRPESFRRRGGVLLLSLFEKFQKGIISWNTIKREHTCRWGRWWRRRWRRRRLACMGYLVGKRCIWQSGFHSIQGSIYHFPYQCYDGETEQFQHVALLSGNLGEPTAPHSSLLHFYVFFVKFHNYFKFHSFCELSEVLLRILYW